MKRIITAFVAAILVAGCIVPAPEDEPPTRQFPRPDACTPCADMLFASPGNYIICDDGYQPFVEIEKCRVSACTEVCHIQNGGGGSKDECLSCLAGKCPDELAACLQGAE